TGASLLLDGFGREASHRQRGPIDDPNDSVRLNYLMTLAEAGYENQLLISHDLALQHWYRRYGGFGWQHIPDTVQQLMRYKGFDQGLIDRILIENPRRLLTFS
ncbi:MAG: aryldialkylphosphatase, partial [Acidimicrobiia bacterium]|nr:aryldialkylphosphatase [Acidimicrobiia bacterium]